MKTTKTLKAGIAVIVLLSSMSLTACGKKLTASQLTPVATSTPQSYEPIDTNVDYGYNDSTNLGTATPGVPNTQVGSFLVDQATLNQWQAKGVAVAGGTIYVSVADTSGLSKKGSVVKMSSSDGKSWKDIGSKYLGLTHPMDATIGGLAVSGGTVVAVDSASKTYLVDSSGNVKTLTTGGGLDVAAGGGGLYISNGSVERSDSSASSRSPIAGLTATGGVGADNLGNVYAVSGNTIKKSDSSGQVMDVVTTDLTAPIDVAADSTKGDIYVLDGSMIKRFNANGQLLVTFSSGATKPVAIAIDESGALYVADMGTTNKDSKIMKFAASVADSASSSYNNSNSSGYGYDSSYSNSSSGYGTYSNTKNSTSTTPNSTSRRQ